MGCPEPYPLCSLVARHTLLLERVAPVDVVLAPGLVVEEGQPRLDCVAGLVVAQQLVANWREEEYSQCAFEV